MIAWRSAPPCAPIERTRFYDAESYEVPALTRR